MQKKYILPSLFMALFVGLLWALVPSKQALAAYEGGKLIDNAAFLNSSSMSKTDIQNFLASKGSGLASRSFVLNCYGADSKERQWYTAAGAPCDQNVPASHIIYYAAQIYGINPQVVLATLQKEQSLVTSPNPTDWQINQAMGYGCPTSGGCGASTFFYQIDSGTWVLRYHYERARGNNSWWNQSSGWVCGTAKAYYTPNLYPGQNVTFIDEDGVAYRTLYLHNAATSSFYCYTPHTYNNPQGLYGLPAYGTTGRYYTGSYNFVKFFELWFDPHSTIYGGVSVSIVSQPYSTPARGQTISYTVSFKNNLADTVTLDAVGAVGRPGSVTSGINRDLGWQGPLTLAAGASQQITFTNTVVDTGTIYIWPAILYQGIYVQYNNWGSTIVGHAANLTLSQPLATNTSTVYAGQNVTFSATLKNNEPFPIKYDALGIPVRFYDTYSYDATWVGPGSLAAGAEIALSGTRNIDKPGPFTYWVSNYLAGGYSSIGSTNKFTALEPTPNFSVSGLTFSTNSPVQGGDLGASFTVTNNLPVPITVGGVGVVGRFGTFNGPNRDIGWQGPVTFGANETKSFTGFSTNISEVGTHYYWIAVYNNGGYLQYNNWGSTIVSRAPSFSVTGMSFSNTSPAVGQNLTVANFSITNNLSVPIDVDGVGVVGRFGTFNGPNRDIGWQGPVHFNANETKSFNNAFTRTITDAGNHYYWIGIFDNGNYLQYNNWGSTIVSHP